MSYLEGRVKAAQRLGLEKIAVTLADLIQQAPDLIQHVPGMLQNLPGMIRDGYLGLTHGVGHAVGPAAAEALSLHMGANEVVRRVRHSETGQKLESNLLAAGIRHGLAGETASPLLTVPVEHIFGPEITAPYHAGLSTGKALAGGTPDQRANVLGAVDKVLADPAISDSSVGWLSKGWNKAKVEEAARQAGQVQQPGLFGRMVRGLAVRKGDPSRLERGLAYAGTAALPLTTGSPILGMHMGLNGVRNYAGTTDQASQIMRDGFERGFRGRAPSGPLSTATDLVVSPALQDPQRAGFALRSAVMQRPDTAGRDLTAAGQAIRELPGADAAITKYIGDVAGPVKGALQGLADTGQGFGDTMLRRGRWELAKGQQTLGQAYRGVAGQAAEAYNDLKGQLNSAGEGVIGPLAAARTEIPQQFSQAVESVKQKVPHIRAANTAGGPAAAIPHVGEMLERGLKGVNSVAETALSHQQALRQAVEQHAPELLQSAAQHGTGLTDAVQGQAQNLQDFARRRAEGIRQVAEFQGNAAATRAGRAVSTLNESLPKPVQSAATSLVQRAAKRLGRR